MFDNIRDCIEDNFSSIMGKVREGISYIIEMSPVHKVIATFIIAIILYYVYVNLRESGIFLRREHLDSNLPIFRFFFADWCPHCRKVKPEWKNLVKKYKGDIQLVEVNCTSDEKNKAIAQKYGVEGFPTFMLSKNGKNIEYDGERSSSGLMDFLQNN